MELNDIEYLTNDEVPLIVGKSYYVIVDMEEYPTKYRDKEGTFLGIQVGLQILEVVDFHIKEDDAVFVEMSDGNIYSRYLIIGDIRPNWRKKN